MTAEAYLGAWSDARARFGDEVLFYAPGLKRYATEEFQQGCECRLIPVSITGSSCSLMCDHCRAVILRHMDAATSPEQLFARARELAERGGSGLLVSGGSGSDGVVPLMDFTGTLSTIRSELGLKVLVHTGLTDKRLASALAEAGIDAAMIDIIGSDESISRVCHLEGVSVGDYRNSLENLIEAGVPTAPHVVIGLDHGRIDGELNAIDVISDFSVASLVLVGLLPQRNTPMEDSIPPTPEQMGEVFLHARRSIPDRPILLGCERPGGEHKLKTDELALRAGLNGIAFPAEGTIGLAESLGLKPRRSEVCCALAYTNASGA